MKVFLAIPSPRITSLKQIWNLTKCQSGLLLIEQIDESIYTTPDQSIKDSLILLIKSK